VTHPWLQKVSTIGPIAVANPLAATRSNRYTRVMAKILKVGIIGAGMIATCDWGYLPKIGELAGRVEVTAITSLSHAESQVVADAYAIPVVCDTVDVLVARDDVDVVLNITPMQTHFAISQAVLHAGKHLISEKPLASTVAEADHLIELAEHQGVLMVCAPFNALDPTTVLVRDAVSGGRIGQPAFARVRSSHAGPAAQAWPCDPTSIYQEGGGPLLDMGVYGLHQITSVFGPALRVTALSGITAPERVIAAGPFQGTRIAVTAPDNNLLLLEFEGSVLAVVDGTFNVRAARSPQLEIFGLDGTLNVYDERPHPDAARVEASILGSGGRLSDWQDLEDEAARNASARFRHLSRTLIIEHMADCLDTQTAPVLGPQHARHVLEIMVGAQQSARDGVTVPLLTTFPRALTPDPQIAP
jgi:predicted dehydrogenase